MEKWVNGILFILLIIIIYQDFKFHAISWFLFPLIGILFFFKGLQSMDFREQIHYFSLNIGIVFLQLVGVSFYFSIKQKHWASVINKQLGIGDILILLAFCLSFSTVNFVFYLLISFILILLIFWIQVTFFSKENKYIPLAGYLGITYNLLLLLGLIEPQVDFFTNSYIDNWLIDII
jgi:hypothetical protein